MLTTLLISTLSQAYNILDTRICCHGHYLLATSQPANIGPQDVPRTSPSNVPRTSPKDPIWRSQGRPNLTSWGRPEMTSRGLFNQTFKGSRNDVPGRLIRDVSRTFSGRLLEDLESTRTWISKLFFQNLFVWPNLKAFQHSRGIENQVKLLRWSIFFKIS